MDKKRILAFAAGLAALALTGCGGTSTNSSLYPNVDSDPTINGLSPAKAIGGSFNEESGLAPSASSDTGYLTSAVASTAKPLASLTVGGTIPLGFAPGATLLGLSGGNYLVAKAAPASSTVVFRAGVANGQKGGVVSPIVPSSLKITSPEVGGFSQALAFDSANVGVGAYPNGGYSSAPFTLPFSTTGLHTLVATVSDVDGRSSTTTFSTVVLKPTDAAIEVEITDADGNAIPGATASITGAIAGATAQTTADAQGVVILFAAPGAQTITVTSGTKTTTGTFTLTAAGLSAVDSAGDPLVIAFP
ncbi:MAG TPA: hypothetical protein VGK19_11980 [Capsulimonadaceae bacterium]|jgi:hypothetical protein